MVEGGINKFLAENTLLGQPFVKDDKQAVGDVLKKANGVATIGTIKSRSARTGRK